jgi:F-type H+-transporting ATPase subunit c
LIQAARIIGTGLAGVGIGVVFGALILGVARNPSLRGPLFSYAISFSRYLLRCNLALIILTIFLVYYFPIIGKSSFNIINLLGYITIALGVGCIRSKSNHLDLSKLLFISFKNAMFSLLNIKNIKIRLIYLILILPLLLAIFGDYTYLFLNFGLIFNNVNMLLNFMINGNDKFLSKI